MSHYLCAYFLNKTRGLLIAGIPISIARKINRYFLSYNDNFPRREEKEGGFVTNAQVRDREVGFIYRILDAILKFVERRNKRR